MSYFGRFGGAFVPEILVQPLKELEKAWNQHSQDPDFCKELDLTLKHYAGRPTALTPVPSFARAIGAPQIALKREDLLHTGAHKLNNTLGQCLLAKKMGKERVIAETGAGQHGVATATACARLGLKCVVYMGKTDAERQEPNVKRMRLLGAEVIAVDQGAGTLKDAVNEALRDWAKNYETTYYCLGSAVGPHPYPQMVAHLQSVIGQETKEQCLAQFGKLPDIIVACVGGGSNAIGIFRGFIDDQHVRLIGVEGGGKSEKTGEHAARFQGGKEGVLHGSFTYLLQEKGGQVAPTHSISAGLDYPLIGPEHSALFELKRAEYSFARDHEALAAFKLLSQTEGIIPALESSHALAYVMREAKSFPKDALIVINLSGRGEKDLPALFANYSDELLGEDA